MKRTALAFEQFLFFFGGGGNLLLCYLLFYFLFSIFYNLFSIFFSRWKCLKAPSIPPPLLGHLSGIVQLCPPQGGAFAVTGQPWGGALSEAILSFFFILKDVHASLFILNFLSAPSIKILNLS